MKWLWLLIGVVSSGAALVAGPEAAVPGDALGSSLGSLTEAEKSLFNSGRTAFRKNYVPHGDPAYFNARSCVACHGEPTFGGGSSSPFNVAFFLPNDQDVSGMVNQPWLVARNGQVVGQRLPQGDYEVRQPNPLYGLGLLEAVSQEDILSREDPSDKDKDGISGRSLRINGKIGRFGWKASIPSIDNFVEKAFPTEMGKPIGTGEGGQKLTTEDVTNVSHTIRFLSFPKPAQTTPARLAGEATFTKIGCAKCHIPELRTGGSPHPSLANKSFKPYTDLLLHDLGRGKATLTTGGKASRAEYRTAPLWGLGKRKAPYFHDASTLTIEEAIERHEGEATSVISQWKALNVEQKKQLLEFLGGL